MRRVPLLLTVMLAPSLAMAAPCPSATTMPTMTGTPGKFTTMNGQIIGPDGKPFIAKGIDLYDGQMGDLSKILQTLPGINFIRLAVYSYKDPSAYQAFIDQASKAGIVVELEDHTNNGNNGAAGGGSGTIYQNAELKTELAWYSSVASAFKGYSNVWFGTNNEPSDHLTPNGPSDPIALSKWQQQTYDAIRGAGNTSIVALEVNGGNTPQSFGAGYDVNSIAKMQNVIGDIHYYGWLTGGSTDQKTVSDNLAANIATTHHLTTASGPIPVIIGEYGPSTSGQNDDRNAQQVVNAVQNSGVGSVAWSWNSYAPTDNLTTVDKATGNVVLTAFGQQVAKYFTTTVCPGSVGYVPVGNVPHVLPKTTVPDVPTLPNALVAPDTSMPHTPVGGIPPTPVSTVPPPPKMTVAPDPPPRRPPVMVPPPINTHYDLHN